MSNLSGFALIAMSGGRLYGSHGACGNPPGVSPTLLLPTRETPILSGIGLASWQYVPTLFSGFGLMEPGSAQAQSWTRHRRYGRLVLPTTSQGAVVLRPRLTGRAVREALRPSSSSQGVPPPLRGTPTSSVSDADARDQPLRQNRLAQDTPAVERDDPPPSFGLDTIGDGIAPGTVATGVLCVATMAAQIQEKDRALTPRPGPVLRLRVSRPDLRPGGSRSCTTLGWPSWINVPPQASVYR